MQCLNNIHCMTQKSLSSGIGFVGCVQSGTYPMMFRPPPHINSIKSLSLQKHFSYNQKYLATLQLQILMFKIFCG